MKKLYIVLLTLPVIAYSAEPQPYKRRKLNCPNGSEERSNELPLETTPTMNHGKIDNNPKLKNFIVHSRVNQRWTILKIAGEWSRQHPDQTISYSAIQKWLRENGFIANIDDNLELQCFIRQKKNQRSTTAEIEEEWNGQHPDQTISYSSIGKWLKKDMPNLTLDPRNKNKIDKNLELQPL